MRKPNNWTSVQIRYKEIAFTVTGYCDGGDFEIEDINFTYPEASNLNDLLCEITEAHPINEIARLAAIAEAEYIEAKKNENKFF